MNQSFPVLGTLVKGYLFLLVSIPPLPYDQFFLRDLFYSRVGSPPPPIIVFNYFSSHYPLKPHLPFLSSSFSALLCSSTTVTYLSPRHNLHSPLV